MHDMGKLPLLTETTALFVIYGDVLVKGPNTYLSKLRSQ